jgi:aminopeptidase C
MVFDVVVDAQGRMTMTKKDNPKEFAEFNKNEAKMILYFYRLNNVVLESVPKDLDFIYKNKQSTRMACIDINRKFSYGFKSLTSKEERKLISGDPRKNYSFNPYVRLNIVDHS